MLTNAQDIVHEMNAPAAGASAHLALLDAGVVEKRGACAVALAYSIAY